MQPHHWERNILNFFLACRTQGTFVEHGQLCSDGGVGVAAALPLRKQEIFNLNWLHAQITTSFEQLQVTRPRRGDQPS